MKKIEIIKFLKQLYSKKELKNSIYRDFTQDLSMYKHTHIKKWVDKYGIKYFKYKYIDEILSKLKFIEHNISTNVLISYIFDVFPILNNIKFNDIFSKGERYAIKIEKLSELNYLIYKILYHNINIQKYEMYVNRIKNNEKIWIYFNLGYYNSSIFLKVSGQDNADTILNPTKYYKSQKYNIVNIKDIILKEKIKEIRKYV